MPTPMFGETRTTLEDMTAWAEEHGAHPRFIAALPIWYELAPLYEIPAESVVAQSWKETGRGHFPGKVPPGYHNWAGIKTREADGDRPEDHQQFPDDRTGIEAQLQHWRKYGGRSVPAGRVIVDPRYDFIRIETDSIEGLGGGWAPSKTYGVEIVVIIDTMPIRTGEKPMNSQLPGYVWFPADAEHHTPSRNGHRIDKYAQHFTAGTDSRAWLTTTSYPPVSAHTLTYHSPTLERRGLQLVKLEHQAWTTGAQINPTAVSDEYEHAGGPLTDQAYVILGTGVVDKAEFVEENGLGVIAVDREHVKGHREWVGWTGGCPDGIIMDRVVEEARAVLSQGHRPEPPRITTTVPDPWVADNPYDKGFWIPVEFLEEIQSGLWESVGYAVSGAFEENGLIVQYFERCRLELHPGQVVMRGLVGREAFRARYPDLAH